MDKASNDSLTELVHALRKESDAYYRQWVVWLGVGSGAGGAGLISLVGSFPDRAHAMSVVIPSLWLFLIGVCTAGLSVLFESLSIGQKALHFSEANNREAYDRLIESHPEIIAAPSILGASRSLKRGKYIRLSKQFHEQAERSWGKHLRWRRFRLIAIVVSALSFVTGAAWILFYISFIGSFVVSKAGIYVPMSGR